MTSGKQPGVIPNKNRRLFTKYSLISDHENNKCICSSKMFVSYRLFIVGAETFLTI